MRVVGPLLVLCLREVLASCLCFHAEERSETAAAAATPRMTELFG